MPRELRRRRGEAEYEDPAEESFVRRAARVELPGGPIVGVIARYLVMALMGGGAGLVVTGGHASEADAVQAERLTVLRQEFDDFRRAHALAEQADREEELQRLVKIETRLELAEARSR